MNKQAKGETRGIEYVDYTWNPFKGCQHGCSWQMPDGQIAECYAKSVADQSPNTYPRGFDHPSFHPDKLDDPHSVKKPARVFVGSMADVFGHWNTRDEINRVLEVVRRCYWHDFLFLTKNAPRYKNWESFPVNAWTGASVPPSTMNGNMLTDAQQRQMLYTTLHYLKEVNATIKWMSVEPLAWDCAAIFDKADARLDWVVVGAATNGKKVYQPKPEWIWDLIEVLRDQGTRIFFKGNLKGNPAAEPWLEEMPASYEDRVKAREAAQAPTQGSLF